MSAGSVPSESLDPASIERGVRQVLADKVSANLAGIWLLVAEHLRLGTWDLLCGWTRLWLDQTDNRASGASLGHAVDEDLHQRTGFDLETLPKKLAAENVNPEIPWLYNYKLDFRFR